MSDPNLLLILKAIQARLQVIDGTGLYYTKIGSTVVRGKRVFSESELPATACYLPGRANEEQQGDRVKAAANITIEAHHAIIDEPEDMAVKMLADIQRAIELEDTRLGGLITVDLQWQEDAIVYPDDAGGYVSVQASYSITHIRHYGDPLL